MSAYKVVLIRHGESEWNKLNKFCGWFDADLSDKGVEEAKAAGDVCIYLFNFFFFFFFFFNFIFYFIVIETRKLWF